MSMSLSYQRAGAILTIDLDAVVENWRLYVNMVGPSGAQVGAVVKASAYGLDVEHVAPALHLAGCDAFFVASLDEAIQLREILGAISPSSPSIHVLYGLMDGVERDFTHYNLTPVLNSMIDIEAWGAYCAGMGKALPCDLHVDTGMSRLGLDEKDFNQFVQSHERNNPLNIDITMSHLACSEDPQHPENKRQLNQFIGITKTLGAKRASLSNSSGVFLGTDYHFDLVRPGAALYGTNPTPTQPNPMAQVVCLQSKILQVRTIDTPRGVGYGSTHQAPRGAKIATLAVGYADGYPRNLSNAGYVYFGEYRAPIVGRVSMDLITVDVTDVPDHHIRPGMMADLIGPFNPLEDVANQAGTIVYELLTRLGARYHRVYLGGTQSS